MPAPLARCNVRLVSKRGATAAVTALIAVLGLVSPDAAAARRSGMKKATKVTQNAFEAVLDAQKPAIVGCVMMHGISQGAPSVKLDFKVLINRQGQVFSMELQVTQDRGDKNQMQTCIKEALSNVQFPASPSALTELRRQWTFAST